MKLLLILILFNESQDDQRLARIIDKDGMTNVRSGPGLSFEVIDTIKTGELFYCEPSHNNDWYKATLLKWQHSGQQVTGYVHKSRIQIIEDLESEEQKAIILTVLKRQKQLADKFVESNRRYNRVLKKWNNNTDSLAYKKSVGELELYSENLYSPILRFLPKVICSTKDKKIISSLMETMWSDKGSASEDPSFSIGRCFACDPELLSDQVRQLKNSEEKKLIIDQIEWGLSNIFETDENQKTPNTKFLELKKKLELVRD